MGCNDRPACLQICCCFPLCAVSQPPRKGWPRGGTLEVWRVGESRALLLLSCFWVHLLQVLPLLSGLISPAQLLPLLAPWAAPPRALASIGCPDFWLWKNYLVLSLQPQGSSSSLLLPASGFRHHFLLASQPFYHLGSQFPLLSSLCLKDV